MVKNSNYTTTDVTAVQTKTDVGSTGKSLKRKMLTKNKNLSCNTDVTRASSNLPSEVRKNEEYFMNNRKSMQSFNKDLNKLKIGAPAGKIEIS